MKKQTATWAVHAAVTMIILTGVTHPAETPAQETLDKEYVISLSTTETHSAKQDYPRYGTASSTTTPVVQWYVVENPESDESFQLVRTYPREAEGWVPKAAPGLPPAAPLHSGFTGWEGVSRLGQRLYPHGFTELLSEQYEAFLSAYRIGPSAVCTIGGKMLPGSVRKIGDFAFFGSNLQVVDFEDAGALEFGAGSIVEFGDYVFAESAISGVPEGSPYLGMPHSVRKMGVGTFKNCRNLKRMVIGDGVEVLPAETFDGCANLREVKLGAALRRVECSITGLTRLAFGSAVPPEVAPGCALEAAEFWVPAEAADAYRAAFPGRNIKGYSFEFESRDVVMYTGHQGEIRFRRTSPGSGESGVVYAYPSFENDSRQIRWSVDATHGSNSADGKFKEVWYRYVCDNPSQKSAIKASNVVYEDHTLFLFSKPGTYKLNYRTLDITDHESSVTVTVQNLPAGQVLPTDVTVRSTSGSATVGINRTLPLQAKVTGAGGAAATIQAVVWKSSDESIATVDDKGVVTGLRSGAVTITATSTDSRTSFFSGSIDITVADYITGFTLARVTGTGMRDIPSPGNYRITAAVNEPVTLALRCTPEDAPAPSKVWVSQAPPISTVTNASVVLSDGNMTFTGTSPGYAQINIGLGAPDVAAHMEVPLHITIVEPTGPTSSLSLTQAASGDEIREAARVQGAEGTSEMIWIDYDAFSNSKSVAWSSSDERVAYVRTPDPSTPGLSRQSPELEAQLVFAGSGSATVKATSGNVTRSFQVIVSSTAASVCIPSEQAAQNINITTPGYPETYQTDFWYFLHQDGTATLTYPGALTEDEPVMPDNPYNFSFPGRTILNNGGYYAVWSPLFNLFDPSSGKIFFTALSLPQSVEHEGRRYTVTKIGAYAFAGSNVCCVDVPQTVVEIGDYAFRSAEKFKGLARVSGFNVVPNSVTSLGKGVFSGCTELDRMVIGSGVTTLPEETFDGCTSLRRLILGPGVKEISCDIEMASSVVYYVVFNTAEPPSFSAGKGLGEQARRCVWVPEGCAGSYASGLGLEAASVTEFYFRTEAEHEKVYSGVLQPYSYSYRTPESGACEYMCYYPDKTTFGTRMVPAVRSAGIHSYEWLSMSFSSPELVRGVSSASSASATMSFDAGMETVTFADPANPFNRASMEIEIVEGTALKSLAIEIPKTILAVGDTIIPEITFTPADATVASTGAYEWIIGDRNVVDTTEDGKLFAKSAGQTTIRLKTTDPNQRAVTSGAMTLTVVRPVESVTIVQEDGTAVDDSEGITGYPGDTFKLRADISPDDVDADAYTTVWSLTGGSATLTAGNDTASLTLMECGRSLLRLTLTQEAGVSALTKEIPVQCLFPVKEIIVTSSGVSLAPGSLLRATEGDSIILSASVNPDATDKSLIWTTSDSTIAAITGEGNARTIEIKGAGNAFITVAASDGQGASITIRVEVQRKKIAVNSIVLSATTLSGKPGGCAILTAHVFPENASDKTVFWNTSDENTASVDANGKVSFIAAGSAVIICEAADSSGVSAACAVTVETDTPLPPDNPENPDEPDDPEDKPILVNSITLSLITHEGLPGESVTLAATIEPDEADNKEVVWESTSDEIASVTDNGVVSLKTRGNAEIVCTAADGGGAQARCRITVTASPTAIDGVDAGGVRISADGGKITLTGVAVGTVVSVYDISGKRIANLRVKTGCLEIPVMPGVYLVRAGMGRRCVKVRL